MEETTALETLDALDKLMRAEDWRKKHKVLNHVSFSDIQDPIEIIYKLIAHVDQLVEGVSSHIFKRKIRGPRGHSARIVTPLM